MIMMVNIMLFVLTIVTILDNEATNKNIIIILDTSSLPLTVL